MIGEARALLADPSPTAARRWSSTRRSHLPLYCDGHKMKGVLVNLIKNAVEAGRNVRGARGA